MRNGDGFARGNVAGAWTQSYGFRPECLSAEQAQSLQETLEGLQMVGKALIGGSKGADKQVYVRMIENLRLTRNVNEVIFDLQVPQSDINILLGVK